MKCFFFTDYENVGISWANIIYSIVIVVQCVLFISMNMSKRIIMYNM